MPTATPLHLLLESHEREWRGTGAVVSALVHGALLLAVVLAYREEPQRENLVDRFVTYLVPPDKPTGVTGVPAPSPQFTAAEAPQGEGAARPSALGSGPLVEPDTGGADTTRAEGRPDPVAELLTESVHTELEVDSAVRRHPESAAPEYPRTMLARNMEGSVFVVFIVDSTGLVDTASFRVIKATHPDFVSAVRAALPGMRFRPALLGGHPVRQLVQQPFTFRITRADSARGRPPV